MIYNLNVNERQKELVLQCLSSRFSEINEELLGLKNDSKDVESIISKIRTMEIPFVLKSNPKGRHNFNQEECLIKGSWYKKAKCVIMKNNYCMTISEIVDELIELGEEKDRKFIQKSISSSISQKIGTHLQRYSLDTGKYAIGLAEWFGNNEKPKADFIYQVRKKEV